MNSSEARRAPEAAETHTTAGGLEEELLRLRTAYDNLKKSEERYRLMFENVPLGYLSMDQNARLIDANNALLDFLGYSRDEFIGKRFADLLVEGVDYHLNVTFPAFKKSGISQNIVWKVRKKDGSVAIIQMNGRVRYDENGNFIQTHCMMQDITEQKKAEKALRKSEQEKALILGAMSDRVIYHDADMRILWANRVAADSSGLPLSEMEGKYCYAVWHQRTEPCEGCPVAAAFQTRQVCTGEMHVNNKVMLIGGYPVLDDNGTFLGVVQVSKDTTERRLLEKQILDMSSREQQRIGHDLHDGLGQHLTGISFLASALHCQLSGASPEESDDAKQIAEHANAALSLMRSLVKGLCPVNKDAKGLMLSLDSLAANVENMYGIACRFRCDEPVLIHNNLIATHLYYITNEAVNNAVKHSKGSCIAISLSCDGDMIRLAVADNGQGGFLETYNGQKGIGLRTMEYRCKMIGAALRLQSTASEGTTVTCSLPVSETMAAFAGEYGE
ncbi:PAS domain S-box protein [Geobacter sp. FeAm09]|uniref:PAS domain-containing sensor histidine kinase n=1 Tax=Geobacter sp. FeAm09 TaxID=2597769 RepID=UPI00143CCDC9|nr:PAS domain S-box protein [Geobacter sp. FeAm09]